MMSNLLRRFVFLCLMSLSFIVFNMGCTSEEEKDAVVNPPATPESMDAGPQDTSPPPVEPLPPVEPAETEPENASPETKIEDVASTENGTPAEFALISSLWETHTKGAPAFTHEKHSKVHKIECNECHHIYENGKNIWKDGMPVAKCGECHDEPTIKNEKKLSPENQKKNLKLAFHNNCRACHKDLKKENPETKAPVTCKQCHPSK